MHAVLARQYAPFSLKDMAKKRFLNEVIKPIAAMVTAPARSRREFREHRAVYTQSAD